MNPARRLRPAVVMLAGLVSLAGLAAAALPLPGLFLVVADPLERSDAIFVLEGGTPMRELEAAALYHRGFAPRIVLTLARDPLAPEVRQLAGLLEIQEQATRVLEHARVPRTMVVRLGRMIENTEQELKVDYDFARAQGFRRVIFVTSPWHTRRVRIIWDRRVDRTVQALIEPTPYERFTPERWWKSRRYLEMTLHEIFGLANFYLGSPIGTFDREG
jgi:uncharacterized SAM-binding protein YcdF (DUF218 family)